MSDDVMEAFALVKDELIKAEKSAREAAADAVTQGNYGKVRLLTGRAKKIASFRKKVETLTSQWQKLLSGRAKSPRRRQSQTQSRLPRGQKTPEEEFYLPILEALVALGGRAEVSKILDDVYRRMQSKLKPEDHEPLDSPPKTPRWRNTAQRARNTLVNKGLLAKNSPRRVWEITEDGRAWLQQNKGS